MTYEANLSKNVQPARTFVVLRPKKRVTDWTNTAGNVWQADFDMGRIDRVFVDGTELVRHTNSTLSSGEFFYDDEAEILYIHSTTDPDTAPKWVVAFYDIYLSTEAGYWHRDPMDDSTEEVFWDGALAETPAWSQQMSDLLFGFFPIEATGTTFINGQNFFDRHVYDVSWRGGQAFVFHLLGELDVDNVRMVFQGFTRTVRWTNLQLEVQIDSLFRIFDTPYQGRKFMSAVDFPNADPDSVVSGEEWPIRKVYGRLDGFSPINVDFNATPATNNNRIWVVSQTQTFKADLTLNINSGGTNNSTTTTLTSVAGLAIGDSFYLSDVSKGATISNIVGLVVTHSAVGARGVLAGATAVRAWLGAVKVRDRNNVTHTIQPEHWTVSNMANGSKGFTLANNFEASYGAFPSPFDPDQDTLYVRVYGETFIDNYAVAGTPTTTVNATGGNLNNIAAIMYQLVKQVTNFAPAAIDETSFQAAVSARTDLVGFSIPRAKANPDYPTYKDILVELLRTGLIRMQINDFSGRAAIGLSVIGPLKSTPDASVDSTEFTDFVHTLGYEDVYSQAFVRYQQQDVTTGINANRPAYLISESAVSGSALYLHEVNRELLVDSLHILGADAQTYVDRVGFIIGDRRGVARFEGRNQLLVAELGETYQVEREALPGYSFSRGTNRTRKYALAESQKSTRRTVVRLEDQKGIEDNSGSW